ncbi:MAG: phosphopantetheine-binding protein [Victivallaceae bacterium]|nr:phosphopantetheine-binding protein [Victivallaceae bacterium]
MSDANSAAKEKMFAELKAKLVEWLSLDDVMPEEIGTDDALFGQGLGLDSLDSVEIVVMLQREYGISTKDISRKKEVFTSVRTLAQYILDNRTE